MPLSTLPLFSYFRPNSIRTPFSASFTRTLSNAGLISRVIWLRSDIRIIDAREGRFSIRRIYFYGREAPPRPSELPASSFRISHTVIPIPNTVIPRRNECDDEESLHTKDLCMNRQPLPSLLSPVNMRLVCWCGTCPRFSVSEIPHFVRNDTVLPPPHRHSEEERM